MAINKIITQKELNYIETLYLYANLEDFIGEEKRNGDIILPKDLEDKYSHDRYVDVLAYINDTLLHKAKYIGEAKGRAWYQFPNYRLGIMDYRVAKKANQFNVLIQYEQHHMFSLGANLKGLELPLGGSLSQYHIKRIDITQIAKTPHDYLTNYSFISSYRTEARFASNDITETIYLGNRRSGNVFRMYNKSVELKTDTKEHPINYKKIELFSSYFGDIENLYTFELELHRKYMKPTFGIDTLEDIDKVYKAYSDIVGKVKIYKDTDENRKHVELKHYDRIDTLYFTKYEECERLSKKKYKPSKYYAIDKAVRAIAGYEKSMGKLSYGEKLLMLDEISSRVMERDVEIDISSSDEERMIDKHEAIRDNQPIALEVEAYRAFRPVAYNNPNEIF